LLITLAGLVAGLAYTTTMQKGAKSAAKSRRNGGIKLKPLTSLGIWCVQVNEAGSIHITNNTHIIRDQTGEKIFNDGAYSPEFNF